MSMYAFKITIGLHISLDGKTIEGRKGLKFLKESISFMTYIINLAISEK